jgi:membrane-anchored protein YejM (alkaline phosphatase superfamily)
MERSPRLWLPVGLGGLAGLGTMLLVVASGKRATAPPAAEPDAPQQASPERGDARRANLVLIVVDTLRADAIRSPEGAVRTPELAGLAREGVLFEQCYSHASMTLPAHAALFSGRFPFETQVFTNEDKVPQDLPLAAEHLARQGYATGAAVSIASVFRLDRGFESFRRPTDSSLASAEEAFPLIAEGLAGLPQDRPFFFFAHLSDPHDPYRAHGTVERNVDVLLDGELLETISASMATNWNRKLDLEPGEHEIELRSDEPFRIRAFKAGVGTGKLAHRFEEGALSTGLQRARITLEVPERRHGLPLQIWVEDKVEGQERIDRYFLEVDYVDAFVGRILGELKERGLYDGSLIVFTSDHGEGLGEHRWWVHADNVYDEQLHVPLIVKPPAGIDAQALRAQAGRLVRHVDVLPTCLEMMGVAPLPETSGASLLRPAERLLLAQTHKPIASRNLVCARDERYKLILDADTRVFEMYDIVEDPEESVDLFARHGHERAAWQELLARIAASSKHDEVQVLDDDLRSELQALGY